MKREMKRKLAMLLIAVVIVGLCFNAFAFANGNAGNGLLGTAGEYNLFVLESATMSNSDSEGRVAVGQSATFHNYAINSHNVIGSNGYSLVVGGTLTASNGQVNNGSGTGNVWAGGEVNASGFNVHNGTVVTGEPGSVIDFEAEFDRLRQLSATLSELPVNGSVSLEYGTLKLTGSDPVLNVFEVNGSIAGELVLEAPLSSTVIINVTGADISMGHAGYFGIERLSKNDQQIINRQTKVLFNFPQAAKVTFGSSGVEGTVLAPYAHVETVYSHIDGTLIAKSINGHMEAHHDPFEGEVPEKPAPSPSLPPSAEPSEEPSATPSATPATEEPSATPSATSATEEPSATPSATPATEEPSATPSATPATEEPSATPSATPATEEPSATPSATPATEEPSATPSATPATEAPSATPSSTPATEAPSATPSATPATEAPSATPSSTPATEAPSATPSSTPATEAPSATPSSTPATEAPSATPSSTPATEAPSATPSSTPATEEPSATPLPSDEIIEIDDEEIPQGSPEEESGVIDGSGQDDSGSGDEAAIIVEEDEVPLGTPVDEEATVSLDKLPKTGDSGTMPFYAAGLIMIALGLIFRTTSVKK